MNAILGTPPHYTEKGRQLASVEIHLSGGPRPFAVEGLRPPVRRNISSGAARSPAAPRHRNRAVATTHLRYQSTTVSGSRPIG